MKVAVLHGEVASDAARDEQDVLVQVEAVSQALAELGYDPVAVPLSLNISLGVARLLSIKPALVFNLVESLAGVGGLIHVAPAVLDHLGLLYTGASTEAMFLTSNKIMAKRVLRAAGILTPPWAGAEIAESGKISFPGPYIVKSIWEHASVGLDEDSVISDAEALARKLRVRGKDFAGFFVESYIDGREFNVALLANGNEPELLPPAEIHFVDYADGKPKVVGYRAKWDPASFEYHHTPRCFDFCEADDSLLCQLADLSRKCWELFGLRGYARVDFRVDQQGQPWVLEINANPCIAPDSGFSAALARRGLDMKGAVQRIINDSVSVLPAVLPHAFSPAIQLPCEDVPA